MSTTSPTREAFEAWYRASHTSAILRRSANGYIDNTTRVAWRAWQAAQPPQEPFTEWLTCPNCGHKSPYSPIKAKTLAEDAERITKQARAALAQRKPWVGLTTEDKKRILDNDFGGNRADCMDAAEKILREKNA